MPRVVVLDAGPLGLLALPWNNTESRACNQWLRVHAAGGTRILVPEIADYEVRRELLRLDAQRQLMRLESISTLIGVEFVPLVTPAMRLAARFWAESRRAGRPTADPNELDADVILAAQALIAADADQVIVATTNARHISRFVPAAEWRDIPPPALP